MLTYHPPTVEPEAWIVADELGSWPALGAQVRALVVGDDVEVGAFGLDLDDVPALIEALDAWHDEGHTASCMVIGVHGTGPAAVWGPSFASGTGAVEVPAARLVLYVVAYLTGLTSP